MLSVNVTGPVKSRLYHLLMLPVLSLLSLVASNVNVTDPVNYRL